MNIISRQISVLKNLYRERIAARPSYQPSPSLGDHERALLDELRRNGIVIVKDFLKPEEADTIRQLLESQISSLSSEQWVDVRKKQDAENLKWGVKMGNAWSFWVNVFQSDFRIMGSEHIAPIIHQFAYHNLITTVGSEYLKEDLKLSFCMANKTVYKPNIPGSGGGWHRDRNYKNGFKALVYLVDTDTNNGCFQYIPRSSSISHHLLKANTPNKFQFTDEEVTAMVQSDKDIMSVTGPKGTLVLFDTNGVHRGSPLMEGGVRYALTNYYVD
jgi:ectoine hydroxylase-related dioxygenase (phytanoyl-CoA dioxygenase family)